jgi:hypothetical protein
MLHICEIWALLLVLSAYDSRQGAVRNLPRWLPQLQIEFDRQYFMSNKVLHTNQKHASYQCECSSPLQDIVMSIVSQFGMF